MTFSIEGIGTALPEHRLTQDEAVRLHTRFCRIDDTRARTLRALYRRSGIATRYSVLLQGSDGPLEVRQGFYPRAIDDADRGPATTERMAAYEAHAGPLAVRSAGRALEAGSVDPSEVTHLVTVSCTGFVSPGVEMELIEELGLRRDTQRTNVGFMGCHGALNGLRIAHSFLASDPAAVPLICSVELCTLHFAYGWDPDMLVANALFSDGAAAVVGRASPSSAPATRIAMTRTPDRVARPAWRVAASGSCLMAESEDAMTWRVGDHGFRMTLSAEVPELIEAHLRAWLSDWLATEDLTLDDIASWAVHPGGPRILTAVERTLGLDRDETTEARTVLSECGNMSSATILFILERMQREARPLPCVALAFGPGLVVEAALLV